MAEKYVMLDMNDSSYDELAQILSNKTAKKIVNALAEKDLSEADIAKELKLPINTIEYSLKKLVKVGLVESTSNFFWSVKGKKIKIYKLANKKIVISTRKSVKTMLISMLGVGIIGSLIKVGINLQNSGVVEKSFDSSLLMEKSYGAISNAPTVISSNTSIFSNVLFWFVGGCLVGAGVYLIYKFFVKGGKK